MIAVKDAVTIAKVKAAEILGRTITRLLEEIEPVTFTRIVDDLEYHVRCSARY